MAWFGLGKEDIDLQLLSPEIISTQYLRRLQADLREASLVRFVVAYISNQGLGLLPRALETPLGNQDSFGVSSLDCANRYSPLLNLGESLNLGDRLKYFLEPRPPSEDEPDVRLLHSKVVYLVTKERDRAVIYLGSHKWSRRALGSWGPTNVEISFRVETDFRSDDLQGNGTRIGALVNRHLRDCFDLAPCLAAVRRNESVFRDWLSIACEKGGRGGAESLERVCVLIALGPNDGKEKFDWSVLDQPDVGIYLQNRTDDEGRAIWDHPDSIVVLVWKSAVDLVNARAPAVLFCRSTARNASPDSALGGTNESISPIEGFRAVIFDTSQQRNYSASKNFATLASGREVHFFDIEILKQGGRSEEFDQLERPLYQQYLQVNHRAFAGTATDDRPAGSPVWELNELAFSPRARPALLKPPGYRVSEETAASIRNCFQEIFNLALDKLRVLASTDSGEPGMGLRVAAHPLHETFLTPQALESKDFYAGCEYGSLVPKLREEKRMPLL